MRKTATLAMMAILPIALASVSLPTTGPLPESKPQTIETKQRTDEKTPVPNVKPEPEVENVSPPADAGHARPVEKMGPYLPTEAKPKSPADETLEEQQLTIAPESVEDHAACLKELQATGADFKEIPRIDDGNGCGIDKPINLSQALPGIAFKPEGTMRCQAALALARWMKDSVIPSASAALSDQGPIMTINQASTYICRLRNNAETGKVSEHARGNAIDVASFTFKSGKTVAVEPRREDSTLAGAFQRAASATGCLYFSTVLDPESDAAHEHHFHLDVMERKGGYRYCH